jgi:hypothetical protein
VLTCRVYPVNRLQCGGAGCCKFFQMPACPASGQSGTGINKNAGTSLITK